MDETRVAAGLALAVVARLHPAYEISIALMFGKLRSIYLNDRNGLKFDQSRWFAPADLRSTFSQERVLDVRRF
jgi:hypothetical protein